MIDIKTGLLVFENITILLRMKFDAFRMSPLYSMSDLERENDGWKVYEVSGLIYKKWKILPTLYFKNDELVSINLTIENEIITSWDDWTEEKCLKIRDLHTKFLIQVIGSAPPWNYRWGEVWSLYDDRSGSSYILIRYDEEVPVN